MKENVLVVEDSEVVSFLISDYLEELTDIELEFTYSYQEAIDVYKSIQPALIICDIHLESRKSGIDFISEVVNRKSDVGVVYISSDSEDNVLFNALETDPYFFLTKPFTREQLQAVVKMALARRNNDLSTNFDISERELAVLHLIGKGYNNHQIGEDLFISHHTVDSRRRRILEKLNAVNINQALYIAAAKGWI